MENGRDIKAGHLWQVKEARVCEERKVRRGARRVETGERKGREERARRKSENREKVTSAFFVSLSTLYNKHKTSPLKIIHSFKFLQPTFPATNTQQVTLHLLIF